MTDQVTYKPPFGLLGALANRLLIANKLQEIFGYRRQKLHHLFNEELQG
jgi:ligand-binding SRPBCC domain-containing protein